MKHLIISTVFFLGLWPSILWAQGEIATKCEVSLDGKSNNELEAILKECETEISANREELKNVQREATTIESGIAELNYKIKQSELEIKRRSIKIRQLEDEINAKRGEIELFNNRI